MSNEVLKQLLNEVKNINEKLNSMDFEVKTINQRLENLESDIKDLKQGQQEIKGHLIELDAKNADRHMEVFSKIKTIDKDVKFIKHKLHQTEEDVFDIKDHLKLIK